MTLPFTDDLLYARHTRYFNSYIYQGGVNKFWYSVVRAITVLPTNCDGNTVGTEAVDTAQSTGDSVGGRRQDLESEEPWNNKRNQ